MDQPTGATGTATTREADVMKTFVQLANSLVDDYDIIDVLDQLVHTCVRILDVAAAGMLLDDLSGGLAVAAASSEDMRTLEVLQAQSHTGPCYDCGMSGEVVHSRDLRAEDRWPDFAAQALAVGFRSVSAVPLRLRGQRVGVLGLFGHGVDAIAPDDEALAQAFADVAAIGLLNQRAAHRATALAEQLRGALDSRVVIEQAKGVVAEREHLTMEQSFQSLRRYARNHNLKLTKVCLDVVEGRLYLPG